MKNLFTLLLFICLISFISCGSDECTADSFVGVYNGSIECPGEPTANGVLTITKVTDSSIKAVDQDNTEFILEVNDCVASSTINFLGVMVTQTLTLDGDKIDFEAVNSGLGVSVTCTGSMTRQ